MGAFRREPPVNHSTSRDISNLGSRHHVFLKITSRKRDSLCCFPTATMPANKKKGATSKTSVDTTEPHMEMEVFNSRLWNVDGGDFGHHAHQESIAPYQRRSERGPWLAARVPALPLSHTGR